MVNIIGQKKKDKGLDNVTSIFYPHNSIYALCHCGWQWHGQNLTVKGAKILTIIYYTNYSILTKKINGG